MAGATMRSHGLQVFNAGRACPPKLQRRRDRSSAAAPKRGAPLKSRRTQCAVRYIGAIKVETSAAIIPVSANIRNSRKLTIRAMCMAAISAAVR